MNPIIENSTEILCIGTELLLGDIVNTNSRWIAQRISYLGLPHYRQSVIGDNEERLINAIKESKNDFIKFLNELLFSEG